MRARSKENGRNYMYRMCETNERASVEVDDNAGRRKSDDTSRGIFGDTRLGRRVISFRRTKTHLTAMSFPDGNCPRVPHPRCVSNNYAVSRDVLNSLARA